MPLVPLFVYIVVVVLLGFLTVWVLEQLAPKRPDIIDRIIWVLVVLVVVVAVAQAFGVLSGGPTVPRLAHGATHRPSS